MRTRYGSSPVCARAREHVRIAEAFGGVTMTAKIAASMLMSAGVVLFIVWTQVTFALGATQWICLATALAPIVTASLLRARRESSRGRGGESPMD